MVWVTFSQNHDFSPPEEPRVTLAYLAGQTLPVRHECAEQAIALGRAAEIATPSRPRARAILARNGFDAVG